MPPCFKRVEKVIQTDLQAFLVRVRQIYDNTQQVKQPLQYYAQPSLADFHDKKARYPSFNKMKEVLACIYI
ncbi:hypothetical protein FGO68_gene3458 [Halteria grandinella]|uniref:Uncharacterized protein n=1 Tax=Halteria grandinella TaxID=5974 RepID=A0A8J8NCT0_HALGN|nr:hypothetical protein FGO68_gene3458 [Halteria grandinella]